MTETQFAKFVDDKKYKQNTAKGHLYAIKHHLNGKKYPLKNLTLRVRDALPTLPLSRREFHLIVDSINTSKEKGKRDLAIVYLMVDSAVRTSETCTLDLRKLDIEERRIKSFWSMKTGEYHHARFGYKTQEVLRDYLRVRDSDDPALFVNVRTGKRLTAGGLKVTIHRLGLKAGIPDLYPHRLRATSATVHISLGASTRKVQILGNWVNLEDVERYTFWVDDDFDKYPSDDW